MLNRALLEEALDIYWVAAHPEEAPELADQHERLIHLYERDAEVRYGRPADPLTDDERDDFDELKRRYNNFKASWTLAGVSERKDLIQRRWPHEARQDINYIFEVVQRQNNLLLHSSPTAYSLAMMPGRRGPNRIGPDLRWPNALGHGALGYYMICRLLADEFDLDRQALEERFHLVTCLTKVLDDELPPGAEACPCGSGRTVGECHGS